MLHIIHPSTGPTSEERDLARRVSEWWSANPQAWEEAVALFAGRLAEASDDEASIGPLLRPHPVAAAVLKGDSPLDVQGESAREIALLVLFVERLANDDRCAVPGVDRKKEHLTMDRLRFGFRLFGDVRLKWRGFVRDALVAVARDGVLGSQLPPDLGEIQSALAGCDLTRIPYAARVVVASDRDATSEAIEVVSAVLAAKIPDMDGGEIGRWLLGRTWPSGSEPLGDALSLLQAAAQQIYALHIHAERISRADSTRANLIGNQIRRIRNGATRVGEAVIASLRTALSEPQDGGVAPPSTIDSERRASWKAADEIQIKSRAVKLSKEATSLRQLAKLMAAEFDASELAIRSWLLRRDPSRRGNQASPEFWEELTKNFEVVRANKNKKPNR